MDQERAISQALTSSHRFVSQDSLFPFSSQKSNFSFKGTLSPLLKEVKTHPDSFAPQSFVEKKKETYSYGENKISKEGVSLKKEIEEKPIESVSNEKEVPDEFSSLSEDLQEKFSLEEEEAHSLPSPLLFQFVPWIQEDAQSLKRDPEFLLEKGDNSETSEMGNFFWVGEAKESIFSPELLEQSEIENKNLEIQGREVSFQDIEVKSLVDRNEPKEDSGLLKESTQEILENFSLLTSFKKSSAEGKEVQELLGDFRKDVFSLEEENSIGDQFSSEVFPLFHTPKKEEGGISYSQEKGESSSLLFLQEMTQEKGKVNQENLDGEILFEKEGNSESSLVSESKKSLETEISQKIEKFSLSRNEEVSTSVLPFSLLQERQGREEIKVPLNFSQDEIRVPVEKIGEVSGALVKRIQGENSHRFRIQLEPESLGKVDVSLEIRKDQTVHAIFSLEKSNTMDLLQKDSSQILEAFHGLGLSAEEGNLQFSLSQEDSSAEGLPSFLIAQETKNQEREEKEVLEWKSGREISYGGLLSGVDIVA